MELSRLTFVFTVFIVTRVLSAFYSYISDCDETFNYWEPLHMLIYSDGLQTWEYSPQYAIRSYSYLMTLAVPGSFISYFDLKPVNVFYSLRVILAIYSSLCETYFVGGVEKKFNRQIAAVTMILMLPSTGLMVASTSFLPSSFSMYCVLLFFGAWMREDEATCGVAMAINATLGWPFASALSLPVLLGTKRKFKLIKYGIIGTIIFGIPTVLIDSKMYGKLVLAPVNIILYNIFASGRGPDLYGTEPWTYYPLNLFLNFNLIIPVASLGLTLIYFWRGPRLTVVSSLIVWLAIFMPQPHKEERFMYPIYPIICLVASLSFDSIYKFLSSKKIVLMLLLTMVSTSTLLSMSRYLLLVKGYSAPLYVYGQLDQLNVASNINNNINLCVGKEWHRFPSSFFLPDARWKIEFIKSEFAGQLPKHFNGTDVTHRDFNDENREEFSRYLSIDQCHLIVDTDYPNWTKLEPRYSAQYPILLTSKFLDATHTKFPWRSFYVPFLSENNWSLIGYNVLAGPALNFTQVK